MRSVMYPSHNLLISYVRIHRQKKTGTGIWLQLYARLRLHSCLCNLCNKAGQRSIIDAAKPSIVHKLLAKSFLLLFWDFTPPLIELISDSSSIFAKRNHNNSGALIWPYMEMSIAIISVILMIARYQISYCWAFVCQFHCLRANNPNILIIQLGASIEWTLPG